MVRILGAIWSSVNIKFFASVPCWFQWGISMCRITGVFIGSTMALAGCLPQYQNISSQPDKDFGKLANILAEHGYRHNIEFLILYRIDSTTVTLTRKTVHQDKEND